MSAAEIRVPDIGDFKDVPVIEVLVKPGDRVAKNDSLIALESEKATMEVPSPQEGTVESIKVNVGDKVSQGSVILTLAEQPAAADKPAAQPAAADKPAAAPARGDAQTIELLVPDIGDFKDVPVIEVLIKPGDRIEKDAPLITLESEKATMEVPSSAAGIIGDVKVRPGDKVSKGTPIATLTADSGTQSAPAQQQHRPAPSEPKPQTRDASSAQIAPPPESRVSVADAGAPASNGVVHASPSIRRFARELGVDLHRVAPTGPNGRVTREDVQQFVKRSLQDGDRGGAPGTGFALAPWPKIDFAQYGEVERRPLSRIKRISGAN
ncbi:MAG TPA: biotin/lipoyl-containing protein, partial [Candidatus Baltobacteraceae bacterium]|nr:biotin/lipoyl-containing protein [Candidatus Baltobacteraceae bacterium]